MRRKHLYLKHYVGKGRTKWDKTKESCLQQSKYDGSRTSPEAKRLNENQASMAEYGSTPTCANICTIVSTCEREMTKRRTCTVREKVAVLAVKKRFELLQIL